MDGIQPERRREDEKAIQREVAVLPADDSVIGAPSWSELQVASVLNRILGEGTGPLCRSEVKSSRH